MMRRRMQFRTEHPPRPRAILVLGQVQLVRNGGGQGSRALVASSCKSSEAKQKDIAGNARRQQKELSKKDAFCHLRG